MFSQTENQFLLSLQNFPRIYVISAEESWVVPIKKQVYIHHELINREDIPTLISIFFYFLSNPFDTLELEAFFIQDVFQEKSTINKTNFAKQILNIIEINPIYVEAFILANQQYLIENHRNLNYDRFSQRITLLIPFAENINATFVIATLIKYFLMAAIYNHKFQELGSWIEATNCLELLAKHKPLFNELLDYSAAVDNASFSFLMRLSIRDTEPRYLIDQKDNEVRDCNAKQLHDFYKNNGISLSPLPVIANQQGPNCGFYAVACATNHHYKVQPHLFTLPPLPARKRDNPKTLLSLRQLRYKAGIDGIGAIFKAKQIEKLIEITECKSITYDINTYIKFVKIITNAIKQNLPVIIPFANNTAQNVNETPDAKRSHWATIVAIQDEGTKLVLAQNGYYSDVSVETLFKAFFHMGEEVPALFFIKSQREWSLIHNSEAQDFKTYCSEKQSLDDFRRKLIVVLPPQASVEQINERILDKQSVTRKTISI
jgi:hypothetical protein